MALPETSKKDAMNNDVTWDRGDGQPNTRRLEETVDDILDTCRPHQPSKIIMFGSGARGELTGKSDIDLLVVLHDRDQESAEPEGIAVAVMQRQEGRVDVVCAFEHEMREAQSSVISVLRTADEEGVLVYRDGEKLPYAAQGRATAIERIEDPTTCRKEADKRREQAKGTLIRAEQRTQYLHDEEARADTTTTFVAEYASKAIALSLQARIIDHGKRPQGWKDPTRLAAEARAAGARMPDINPEALARAGNYYSGQTSAGYPQPSPEEAQEALDLARLIVGWQENDRTGEEKGRWVNKE